VGDDDGPTSAWIDRLAIEDVVRRYCDATTRGDWSTMERLFAPDAVWEHPGRGWRFESAKEFVDFVRAMIRPDAVMIQTTHGSIVDLTGPDTAISRTTLHELVHVPGAFNAEGWGIYFDELRRVDGAWRFTHRVFHWLLTMPDHVMGTAMSARPVPLP
jgi:hypothetical protein